MGTACATSLTKVEGEKRNGDERNRGPDGFGRKIATRVGYNFPSLVQGIKHTCEDRRTSPLQVQCWTLG